jgi:hypothetical protein
MSADKREGYRMKGSVEKEMISLTQKQEFYVSLHGSDSNKGTKDSPFATLEAARDAIRVWKQRAGSDRKSIVVYLREGEYRRTDTFELTELDGGTEDASIMYCAYPGEEVRITGAVQLESSQFGKITDSFIINRLPEAAREHVVQFDLAAVGIDDYGIIEQYGFGWHFHRNPPVELFFNLEPLQLARWPNDNYVHIGEVEDQPSDQAGTRFKYLDARPETWDNYEEVWMYGYWRWDWADGNMKLDAVIREERRIDTSQVTPFNEVKSGQRYYYYNVLEELDTPGEWYLDRKTGMLYVYPPAPLSTSTVHLSLLNKPLITMQQVAHIEIMGIIFEATRDHAVCIQEGSRIRMQSNIFRNLGNLAVHIQGGQGHSVMDCQIYNTGYGGIKLDGGNRDTLVPGEHNVIRNEFYNFSRIQATYTPAVELAGVGNRISGNTMHHAPHMAILIHGNNHVIEFNEIYAVLQQTSDAGAIYMGADWSEQGNIIRYNYLHDLTGIEGIGQMGIYLDDMASGTLVYGNILDRINVGMLVGGGRNNLIANNLILSCDKSILLDERGLNWAIDTCLPGGRMLSNLEKVPYLNEQWTKRYPDLLTIQNDEPGTPKYNTVQMNVLNSTPPMDIADTALEYGIVAYNWKTDEDPGFVDLSRGNYMLRSDAPVFNRVPGFRTIPFAEITSSKQRSDVASDLGLHQITLLAPSNVLLIGTEMKLWTMADTISGMCIDLHGSLTFYSSDPDVVKVDERGVVTGVADGSAFVTVTGQKEDVSRSDTVRITVVRVCLKEVELEVNASHVVVGQSACVTKRGFLTNDEQVDWMDAQITYMSTDRHIAEIDERGIVRTHGIGETILHAEVEFEGVVRHAKTPLIVHPPC